MNADAYVLAWVRAYVLERFNHGKHRRHGKLLGWLGTGKCKLCMGKPTNGEAYVVKSLTADERGLLSGFQNFSRLAGSGFSQGR